MAVVTFACVLFSSARLCAQAASTHLLPAPREIQLAALQPLPQGIRITCASCFTDHDDEFTAQDLTRSLAARAIPTTGTFSIVLARTQALPPGLPPEAQPEGYTINPGPGVNPPPSPFPPPPRPASSTPRKP